MKKQVISLRQAISTLAMFITGSSVILGGATGAGQDSWISLLFSMALVIPTVLVYARIMKLFPEKSIYEIIEILFGRFVGKIIIILLTWYALHLAALVFRNFSEFIEIVSMPETPQLPIMLVLLLVTVYLAKSGIQTIGKWAIIVLFILLTVLFLTVFLLLNQMDFTNILPIMNHSTKTILAGSYRLFSFPFAETVLFLSLADSIKKEDSPYKVYVYGVSLGAIILLLVILRNIEALGPALYESSQFPSYTAARIINVGDFLARVEGTISMNFILTGITKITICLLAASKGLCSLFQIKDYKKVVFPVGLTAMALASIIYKSAIQMLNFIKIYEIYAILFQIVIPVLIWVGAEIKTRDEKKGKEESTFQ